MMVIDVGNGPPLVLIPGIQGRWEYLRPAIDALARSFRVLTFPLCGERGADRSIRPGAWIRQRRAADHRGARPRRASSGPTICGISFGGLPAIRFAAQHPERTLGADSGVDAGTELAPAAAASRLRAGALAVWSALPGRVAVPAARASLRSAFPDRQRALALSPLADRHVWRARRCRRRAWRSAPP